MQQMSGQMTFTSIPRPLAHEIVANVMQRANAGFKRAAGSGEGLRRTALDVLQHQRQAPRLVLRQALGCRPAPRLIGKPPAAVLAMT